MTDYLRSVGVNTPTYRKDSWEVDWSKRKGKKVWARNLESKMPTAKDWHWIRQSQFVASGMTWKPLNNSGRPMTGRYVTSNGYVQLTQHAMTEEEIKLARDFGLFRGKRKTFVREHHLVAVKKYRVSLLGKVVRHINGIKADNRPENLVIGTTQENTMDHNTARVMAMYWRNKFEQLVQQVLKGEARQFLKENL